MSSAGPTPASPRPSVFISYASEDRVAARALRDAFVGAGLDVWYDENELGGGDAWDQKIRRQIRDCDYFVPLVSATTERRKEGYFRREWRLAAERTMDMADDVLFLLPVAIDGTSEVGARVPEKFLTVQWLRLPGGQRTPALDTLIARLLAGEHTALPPARPPLVARPPAQSAKAAPTFAAPPEDQHRHVPPMPPFPPAPEKGGVGPWLKFAAETAWWGVTAGWLLFTRLPRWLRILLTIWFVFLLLSTCDRGSNPRPRGKEPPAPAASSKAEADAIAAAIEQVAGAVAVGAKERDWDKFGEELARRFGKAASKADATDKRLVLVPFAPAGQDPAVTQFVQRVFAASYGKLVLARPGEASIATASLATASDEAFAGAGRELRSALVLGFRVAKPDAAPALAVRLIRSADGSVVWSADYPVAGSDAAAAGEKVAEAVMAALP